MCDKKNLIEQIEKIPKFVLRDIAVKEETKPIEFKDELDLKYPNAETDIKVETKSYEWKEENHYKAVTEENKTSPLTFVTDRYKLVQFSDVFLPLIENITELQGDVTYFNGIAFVDVFPKEEKLQLGTNDKIGMVAINSVNKQSSVIVKFCILHNNKKIAIPKKIAGFKKVHIGKVKTLTENFLYTADKIRDIWNVVLTEFQKIDVNEDYCISVLDSLEIKETNLRKKIIKKVESTQMNLWDMFLSMIDIVEDRKYKSDCHKRKKLDKVSEQIFKYATISKLINN